MQKSDTRSSTSWDLLSISFHAHALRFRTVAAEDEDRRAEVPRVSRSEVDTAMPQVVEVETAVRWQRAGRSHRRQWICLKSKGYEQKSTGYEQKRSQGNQTFHLPSTSLAFGTTLSRYASSAVITHKPIAQ